MKVRTFFKSALSLLLVVLMLLSAGLMSITASVVDIATTGANTVAGGYVYFDNTKTQWSDSCIQFVIGHSSFSRTYTMTKITNTNLYYVNLSNSQYHDWGDATYYAVIGTSSKWGDGNWGSSNLSNATHRTAAYTSAYNMDGDTKRYLVIPSSSSNGTSISINYQGTTYGSLNKTQTVYVHSAANGSSTYANDASAGTASVSGYYLSANSTATTRSASTTLNSTYTTNTSLAPGSTITLTATANTGYTFKGWYNSSGTLLSSNATYTTTHTGSTASYYARFEKAVSEYSYTVEAGEGGTVSPTSGSVEQGKSVEITATPSTGYEFAGWAVTGGSVASDSSATTNFTPNTNGAKATASFKKLSYPVKFSVDPSAGGSITATLASDETTAVISGNKYDYDTVIILTANANSTDNTDYSFTGWDLEGCELVGGYTVSQSTIRVKVKGEVTATANFETVNKFNVTVTESGGTGSVTINNTPSTSVKVVEGESAKIVIAAPTDSYISSVTVQGTSVYSASDQSKSSFEYTITGINSDRTVTVTYIKKSIYQIQVEAYDNTVGKLYYNGTAIPAAGTVINAMYGTSVAIVAEPNANYSVASWLVDEKYDGRESTYTFSNISGGHKIKVSWVEVFELDVTVMGKPNDAGTVTATSNGVTVNNIGTNNTMTVEQFSTIELTATVTDNCYEFVGWTITGGHYYNSGDKNSESISITANAGDVTCVANFTKVYKAIYLKNDANWTETPHIYYWGGSSSGPGWPGEPMTYDSVLGYWVGYVKPDATNVQFNKGNNSTQIEFELGNFNLFSNGTDDPTHYVEAGYYLQGTWNAYNYSAYDLVKFESNGDGTYSLEIPVTSTTDGYIYVNPTNENSHFWNAAVANDTSKPQVLTALGKYTANPNRVKILIDSDDYSKDYDVVFTFNPTTGDFDWTVTPTIPTVTVKGSDGRMKNNADANMISANGRVGDTYFEIDDVKSVSVEDYYEEAKAYVGYPVTFYTEVNENGADGYDYYVAGWVINGDQFVAAANLGNGVYSGSYTFTEDSSVIPVYFHTEDWLTAHSVSTVTVYAVADTSIDNWDRYMSVYPWFEDDYKQFGTYTGQVMIPVTGIDGVYYTYIETTSPDGENVSGVTFNNHGDSNNGYDVSHEVDYSHIQTYDYYEFMSLLSQNKQNITFVLKKETTNVNIDDINNYKNVGTTYAGLANNFNFRDYVDYSGELMDFYRDRYSESENGTKDYVTADDPVGLYIVRVAPRSHMDDPLNGYYYVDCYIYDATGKHLGVVPSYKLMDPDAVAAELGITGIEGKRVLVSYEALTNRENGDGNTANRYDGEWYGDTDVSVTINLAVNVALKVNDTITVDPDIEADGVNVATYGAGYVNATLQNVDVTRGTEVKITATPKTGYKFVGWYSASGSVFSTNTTATVTAAVGTTYTAVFEALASGSFYVNHYIYSGAGSSTIYIPKAHNGSAQLYVGIENTTDGTSVPLSNVETAYLEADEDDELIITIATDAHGADRFYSWYVDAVDSTGTTFEEVGIDSEDNLYTNVGDVVGSSDMVYFRFKYTVKDTANETFSITLYSDLMPVSVNKKLVYKYNDRYGNIKSYTVPYTLTAEEIEGFAGNENTPYTPAYISGEGWDNTVLKYAPYIEDYYKDTTWTINTSMYDPITIELWATQPTTMYTVTSQIGADVAVNKVPYNSTLTLDARELSDTATDTGFWYNDVNLSGTYEEGVDIIMTYGPRYGLRVTCDTFVGYQNVDEYDFAVSIDKPVYGREQVTDDEGNNKSDKVIVDYLVNYLTPYFYANGSQYEPWYGGEKVDEKWNGYQVTLETLEKLNYEFEYGVILEQVGSFREDKGYTYEEAYKAAVNAGYGTATNADTLKGYLAAGKTGMQDGKYYVVYNDTNSNLNDLTNRNRLLFTISYTNNIVNRGKYFNAYGYIMVKDPSGNVQYYISNVQTLNIYDAGTSDAVIEDNTTFE